MNITDTTQKGPDVDDIFETLPDTGEDKDYKDYISFQKSTPFTRNTNFVRRNSAQMKT